MENKSNYQLEKEKLESKKNKENLIGFIIFCLSVFFIFITIILMTFLFIKKLI